MRRILPWLLLAGAACSSPSDYATPCPADKQFCVVQTDGGCEVTELVCCEGTVPTCAGTYTATLPTGCTTHPPDACG